MFSRRKFIGGLAAIIAAQKAPSAPVKSLLAARGTSSSGGGGAISDKSYVQDGLVAMLDGTNGLSEDGWIDLVSGNVIPLGGNSLVGKHVEIVGSNVISLQSLGLENTYSGDGSAEIDVDITGLTVFSPFFGVGTVDFYIYCWGAANLYWNIYAGSPINFKRHQGPATYATNCNVATLTGDLYENGVLKSSITGARASAMWTSYLRANLAGAKVRGIRVYNRILNSDEITHNAEVSAAMPWA